MVEGIIGRKIGMTQIFDDQGSVIPVTLITAGPCAVIQKKTRDKDGYAALQLGYVEEHPKKRPNKADVGHFQSSQIPPTRISREFGFDEGDEVKPGDRFTVDVFSPGERVNVIGISKGKGFAGVFKRWGFHGGRKTHGSMFHRRPGSIGASAYPSRVIKGKKMPGQMGGGRTTVRNLTVVETDTEKNLLVVKGAVPGAPGGILLIKKSDFQSQMPAPNLKEEKENA